jgi:hypothetical protein
MKKWAHELNSLFSKKIGTNGQYIPVRFCILRHKQLFNSSIYGDHAIHSTLRVIMKNIFLLLLNNSLCFMDLVMIMFSIFLTGNLLCKSNPYY